MPPQVYASVETLSFSNKPTTPQTAFLVSQIAKPVKMESRASLVSPTIFIPLMPIAAHINASHATGLQLVVIA